MNNKILILLFLVFTGSVFSQKIVDKDEPKIKYLLGGYAKLNFADHSSSFSEMGVDFPNCCTEYTSATGMGYGLGFLFEYPINDRFSIDTRLGFEAFMPAFTEDEFIGNVELIDRSTGQTAGAGGAFVDYQIDSDLSMLQLRPMLRYRAFKNFNIQAGLNFGYFISGTFSQSEVLDPLVVEEIGLVFADTQSDTRNRYTETNIPDLNAFQMFIPFGASYDIVLKNDLRITPEINYNLALTGVTSSSTVDSWSPHYLDFGVAIKKPIREKVEKPFIRETEYIRDTVTIVKIGAKQDSIAIISSAQTVELLEDEEKIVEKTTVYEEYEKYVAKAAKLNVTLEAFGLDEEGNLTPNPTVVIEEIETEQEFPLLPYVFFPENSSYLVDSNLNLLDKDEVTRFSMDNLDWNTMKIYSDMLNIVGYRMMQNPDAELTITGTNNNSGVEEGNISLSSERAKSVKEYLVDTWGIDSRRIKTSSRNLPSNPANNERAEGLQENRRAELTSNNDIILSTVSLSELVRDANPPMVRIVPSIDAESGLKNWDLDITQRGVPVRTFNGSTTIPEKIDWDIETDPIPNFDDQANIKLTVKDETGQEKVSDVDVDIEQLTIKKKRSELRDDVRIEKFSLILFDYDKADLTSKHKNLLDRIKGKIMDNSSVTVTGYADRTGNPQYNKELAGRRAQEVIDYLGLPNEQVTLENMGSNNLMYENATPVGRSYSRTVILTIETPVE